MSKSIGVKCFVCAECKPPCMATTQLNVACKIDAMKPHVAYPAHVARAYEAVVLRDMDIKHAPHDHQTPRNSKGIGDRMADKHRQTRSLSTRR